MFGYFFYVTVDEKENVGAAIKDFCKNMDDLNKMFCFTEYTSMLNSLNLHKSLHENDRHSLAPDCVKVV